MFFTLGFPNGKNRPERSPRAILAYTRNWPPPQRKALLLKPIDPIAEQAAQARNISIEEVNE
jgi:hypothetical protein